MPEKGARNLILVSRSGAKDDDARQTLHDLESAGVNVEVCCCDIGDAGDAGRTLAPVLQRMSPVRGVVYGALQLRVSCAAWISFCRRRINLGHRICFSRI